MITTDPRFWLYQKIQEYTPWNSEEEIFKETTLSFVESIKDCFEVAHLEGHITGEAWILN